MLLRISSAQHNEHNHDNDDENKDDAANDTKDPVWLSNWSCSCASSGSGSS